MTIAPPLLPLPASRDPAHLMARMREAWGGQRDFWVFGYASLIWRPEFESAEHRPARVHGWHRAFEMKSRVNRGSADCPGLVFALVTGGSCLGMAYRIAPERIEEELPRLWEREMVNSVYDPKWLPCRTPQGPIHALAFTLNRASPNYTGAMSENQLVEILRHARGRYGTTLAYLLETFHGLARCGIHDRKIEQLVRLAARHGLVEGTEAPRQAGIQRSG